MIDRVLPYVLSPQRIVLRAWRVFPFGSFALRLRYDVFPRPHYAYCVYQAARLAESLGIERISVLEFGVAGGLGLLELERLAAEMEREVPTRIDIFGFDTGKGLPKPIDYRDLPSVWRQGFFEMDEAALRARLSRARLVLGDVEQTVPAFFDASSPAPIGAVLFDLDYYSSTVQALRIFDTAPERLLPRVFCYMDDVISSDTGIHCDSVGPLLAIREYNAGSAARQLAPIAGFASGRPIRAQWNEQIYVHHAFEHPAYDTYVHPDGGRQLPLPGAER